MPVPPLGPDGHLPVGRYLVTLRDVEDRFVLHSEFARSSRRRTVWAGLLRWLEDWKAAEEQAGVDIMHSLWMAGSFISSEVDPSDIDVTPVVSQGVVHAHSGSPGIGKLKKLMGHRERVQRTYHVDVFPLPWYPVDALLRAGVQSLDHQTYMTRRGILDDFWQRKGPEIAGPLTLPTCHAERGLLEVML